MQVLHSYHVMHTFANNPFYQQPAYQVIHMLTISANTRRPIETNHPKDFPRLGNLLAEARRVDPIIKPSTPQHNHKAAIVQRYTVW